MGAAAIAGILSLGVLADDQPVELGRPDVTQRAGDAGEDAGGADICVLVKPLADRQAQAPQGDVVGDIRSADCAEIDRIGGAELREAVLRHQAADAAVALGTPIIALDPEAEGAVTGGERVENLEPGVDDLRADAVRGDRGDQVLAHGRIVRFMLHLRRR